MIKPIFRGALALFMTFAGVMHFVSPEPFTRIVPPYLPYPLALVYLSGVFEILGGVGLMIPRLRRSAGIGLIALYIAVFPANLHMAINQISFGEGPTPPFLLWLRLPMQLVLILWAGWVSLKPETNLHNEGGKHP